MIENLSSAARRTRRHRDRVIIAILALCVSLTIFTVLYFAGAMRPWYR